MSGNKEAVILVVITFLLVILIYSSVANLDAFARKKITTLQTCYKSTPDKTGATSADVCCTIFYSNGQLSYSLCQKCNYGSDGNKIDCRNYTPRAGETGAVNPPPSAGAIQPPSSPPPPSNTLPPPSLTSPSQQQTITTCPDGSAPDANGNCPTTTTNQQIAPSQSLGGSASNNNNNNPTPEHHHKGSNQPTQIGGAQESTVTKKHKVPKTDQGTTQSPS